MTVETTSRAARADHILDVAAELLNNLGYRRVTVEDIAEAADIGKGTIYLHWKTREALFVAVLQREFLATTDQLVAALRVDPYEVLLNRIIRRRFQQICHRPLLSAVYTNDSDLLGKLRNSVRSALAPRHRTAFEDYLALLGASGLLRDGITPAQASQAFHAILNGFLLTPDADVDLMGGVIAGGLEPAGPEPDASVLRPIAERAAELFGELAAADRAVLRSAY
ncbi:MAG TPA: helix-turn-helix domain-containing protein [Pseudonocardiaceae bacterium]|nr:helix-turn-helix domain-containing protein [Pseudonocardiaceae bacterium]